jgi:hypothetical protein
MNSAPWRTDVYVSVYLESKTNEVNALGKAGEKETQVASSLIGISDQVQVCVQLQSICTFVHIIVLLRSSRAVLTCS